MIVCPSGLTACHGTCVDVQSDDGNCGGCGIACTAPSPSQAACTLGRCLVTLAWGEVGDIAVGTSHVYFTTYGENRVMSVPGGGGPTIIVADGQADPFGIAVDTSNVYWTNYDLDGRTSTPPTSTGPPTTTRRSRWPAAARA